MKGLYPVFMGKPVNPAGDMQWVPYWLRMKHGLKIWCGIGTTRMAIAVPNCHMDLYYVPESSSTGGWDDMLAVCTLSSYQTGNFFLFF